jgi:hypothetical protein
LDGIKVDEDAGGFFSLGNLVDVGDGRSGVEGLSICAIGFDDIAVAAAAAAVDGMFIGPPPVDSLDAGFVLLLGSGGNAGTAFGNVAIKVDGKGFKNVAC